MEMKDLLIKVKKERQIDQSQLERINRVLKLIPSSGVTNPDEIVALLALIKLITELVLVDEAILKEKYNAIYELSLLISLHTENTFDTQLKRSE